MQIELHPVDGSAATVMVRVEDAALTVDGTAYAYDAIPVKGPVRLADQIVIVEYGAWGGVSTCELTAAHLVVVFAPDTPPPSPVPAEIDRDAEAATALQNWRENTACEKWQIKTAMGEAAWLVVEMFGNQIGAPWGLKTVIADATNIPRMSQTVDLLAHILGWDDAKVDALFSLSLDQKA